MSSKVLASVYVVRNLTYSGFGITTNLEASVDIFEIFLCTDPFARDTKKYKASSRRCVLFSSRRNQSEHEVDDNVACQYRDMSQVICL